MKLPVTSLLFRRVQSRRCRRGSGIRSERLHAEADPAAAGAPGIGVLKNEPATEQARIEIEGGAVENSMAPRVDPDAHALRAVEHEIGLLRRRFPGEHVFEARAATGLDADTKPARLGVLLLDELLNLARRGLGHREFAGVGGRGGSRVAEKQRSSNRGAGAREQADHGADSMKTATERVHSTRPMLIKRMAGTQARQLHDSREAA